MKALMELEFDFDESTYQKVQTEVEALEENIYQEVAKYY